MKTLNLNACGVTEMNREEMVKINGGGTLIVYAVKAIVDAVKKAAALKQNHGGGGKY